MTQTTPVQTPKANGPLLAVAITHLLLQLTIIGTFTYYHFWVWFFTEITDTTITYGELIAMHSISPIVSGIVAGIWIASRHDTWKIHVAFIIALIIINFLYVVIMGDAYN